MKPIGLSSPDLIVRSTATRSEAGRLEGRRLARPSPCGHPSRRIACAMLPGDEVRNDADMIRIRGTLTDGAKLRRGPRRGLDRITFQTAETRSRSRRIAPQGLQSSSALKSRGRGE